MAKFPVEIGDHEGIIEAINNLLSGPSGLGQNFAGFSSYTPGWLTGNFRVPYTISTMAPLYVADIALSQSEMTSGNTWKFTFAVEQATPPFINGNNLSVKDVDNSWYNDSYGGPGVVECTTKYVTVRTIGSYPIQPASPNGFVYLITGINALSTDANARVTVTGGTDRVFISGQVDTVISYLIETAPAELTYTVEINRYYGVPNNDPVNPDYVFQFSGTVAQKKYTYTALTDTGSIPQQETIFTAIIDTPSIGFYWYILDVSFEFTSGLGQVTECELGLRNLSAQVVKQ
jgi:hypothetical protein